MMRTAGSEHLSNTRRRADFKPIEQVFAKVEALLRTAAARTTADPTIAIEDAFAAIRPDEGRNYLTAAGYDAFEPT